LSELIWQGLELSLMGLGLTFAALGLLIGAIILLDRLFPARRSAPEQFQPVELTAGSTLTRATEEEEIVAAIAVALAQLRSLEICRSGLGSTLEGEPSPWWTTRRNQQYRLGWSRLAHPAPSSRFPRP